MEQYLWVEKYRPRTVEECILPDSIKAPFQEYVKQHSIPNLLLTGSAGVGKTTIAKALCEEIGCDYIVINGSNEGRKLDDFRSLVQGYATSMSMVGGRKVIIVDEADYMNAESVQPLLRGWMEEFSGNCSFIFTCNYKNKIIPAIHSRCAVVEFKLQNGQKAKMASAFFKRVEMILTQEKITYEKQAVAAVVTKYFPDNRRILNELQRYASSGTIDTGILSVIGDTQISELIEALRNKDFGTARKWCIQNNDSDATSIFRRLYDSMYDFLAPSSIPQCVLILAKYQYQAAFVADHELNIMACLTEIMVECEFK